MIRGDLNGFRITLESGIGLHRLKVSIHNVRSLPNPPCAPPPLKDTDESLIDKWQWPFMSGICYSADGSLDSDAPCSAYNRRLVENDYSSSPGNPHPDRSMLSGISRRSTIQLLQIYLTRIILSFDQAQYGMIRGSDSNSALD